MSARITILDILDPAGAKGLAPATEAAYAAGATDVVPVSTGTIIDDQIDAATPRAIERALAAALTHHDDALLVGVLPNAKIATAVNRALARGLPQSLVMAPGDWIPPSTWFAGAAQRQQRTQFQALVRETTVGLLTTEQANAWLGIKDAGAIAAGTALCDAGAYAAWIRDDAGNVRALDRLVTGAENAVLDYPALPADRPDRIPGALTALLGQGFTLQESVASAQRVAAGSTESIVAVR